MLVFSSVEMTNSSWCSTCPCQRRSYRSRMRPALAWKCGSRGKIQQRCCQGRIASSCNQRHTVLSLMLATSPERCACRATSATLSRDSGRPKVVGRSHASALISTVSSGGKDPGASRASPLFEARQSFLEEALAPLADHLASRVQPRGDLVVVHATRGHQDHLGSNNLEIRQRISGGATIQLGGLVCRQLDKERALSWHAQPPVEGSQHDAIRGQQLSIIYVTVFTKPPTKLRAAGE